MRNSRRNFIHTCWGLVSAGFLLNSCETRETQVETLTHSFSGDPCEDMRGLTKVDLDKRTQLGYEEKSPIPESQCHNCQLYLPPNGEMACGGCMLFKGPVFAEAYCTYWAPQV